MDSCGLLLFLFSFCDGGDDVTASASLGPLALHPRFLRSWCVVSASTRYRLYLALCLWPGFSRSSSSSYACAMSLSTCCWGPALRLLLVYTAIALCVSLLTRFLLTGSISLSSRRKRDARARRGEDINDGMQPIGGELFRLATVPTAATAPSYCSPTTRSRSLSSSSSLPPSSPANHEELGDALIRSSPSSLASSQQDMIRLLCRDCCALPACSKDLTVMNDPVKFYAALCELIERAADEVVLCALYIGDGPLSHALVKKIVDRMRAVSRESTRKTGSSTGNRPFTVTVVMDYHRMKDKKNLTTLMPLLVAAAEITRSTPGGRPIEANVSLYQHPSTWSRRLSILGRATEALGVLHAKIFMVDRKHLILTGANLSDDYFTTRTDRYLLVKDSPLVGMWFYGVVRLITSISHPVQTSQTWECCGGGVPVTEATGLKMKLMRAFLPQRYHSPELTTPLQHRKSGLLIFPNSSGVDPVSSTSLFVKMQRGAMVEFAKEMRDVYSGVAARLLQTDPLYDTVLFPTLQCGPAGVMHDSDIVERLLRMTTAEDHLYLSSPYMNMYYRYLDAVLEGDAHLDCVTASVQANGWHAVKGAAFIPQCYLQLERTYFFLTKDFHCDDRMKVSEYDEAGKTFHSKGLWFVRRQRRGSTNESGENKRLEELKDSEEPYLVGYGSSNYGCRSVNRDVEVALFCYSSSPTFRAATGDDLRHLLQTAEEAELKQFVGDAPGRFQPVVSLLAQLGIEFL